MQHMGAVKAVTSVFLKGFSSVALLCLASSGCNSCYSGFWNGNASGLAVSTSSCPLATATSGVIAQLSVASASHEASSTFPAPLASQRDVQHIFVTLSGIEANASAAAHDDSPDWVELAPDLTAHPAQLDLLAVNGDSRSLELPAGANVPVTIPADEYRQLRLRLVPVHPPTPDLIPDSNGCGNVGWNCIVFADRSVRPLEFDGAVAEFHITQERGTDDVFRVLPDDVIHLSIEFNAAATVFFASSTAVRLVPVFRVVFRAASPSDGAQ
jgi:hypothetical protein